jgi:formate dehydrogenase subunit gamma
MWFAATPSRNNGDGESMMKRLCTQFVAVIGACAIAFCVSAQQSSGPSLPAAELAKQQQQRSVEQPYNNQPVWSSARGATSGYTSVVGPETGVLIQDGGQTWRALRNGTVSVWGGWAIVAMMLLVGGFYAWKGTIQLKESPTGRMIGLPRFRFQCSQSLGSFSRSERIC